MITAICDDEGIYRTHVKKLCQSYFNERNISSEIIEFSSGEEFLSSVEEINIVLLDIEMSGINGITVKEQLEKLHRDIRIIYITSHIQFMENAFGKNVYSFLTKPVMKDKFCKVMDLIIRDMEEDFIVKIDNKDNPYINCKTIIYIKAQDKYTTVKTREGEYLVRRSMNDWENILANRFFYRIHKSYIINLAYVKRIDNLILMDNGEKVTVSKRYIHSFKESYYNYIKRKVR